MGNILGNPQTFYVSYDCDNPSECNPSSLTSDEQILAPYAWPRFFSELMCCPWCENNLACEGYEWDGENENEVVGEDWGWAGTVIGIARRRGCRNRDHWTLVFRSGVDVSQLPKRINGLRTQVPRHCGRSCGGGRRMVYVMGECISSDGDADGKYTSC
ncbi:hypothetical protein GGR53DRAFT_464689 [Hypoxylon sp. FL1150]|nr:hypothetical protein GGR53DRAFT_464689 [Hypoxylon sp. FL1150]